MTPVGKEEAINERAAEICGGIQAPVVEELLSRSSTLGQLSRPLELSLGLILH